MAEPLLLRAANQDRTAIELVLERYGSLVWSLARRFCGNVTEAEDAVQEIFLEVWRSAGRYNPDLASEATFIATIARRRLIDLRRKLERRPDPVPLPDELISKDTEVDRAELSDEASRAIRALEQLRPEQKQVLELSIYKGLTHERISATIGMPLGTVKTHARRGLMSVRDLLDRADSEAMPRESGASSKKKVRGGTK